VSSNEDGEFGIPRSISGHPRSPSPWGIVTADRAVDGALRSGLKGVVATFLSAWSGP
jgi:hypothetical protein